MKTDTTAMDMEFADEPAGAPGGAPATAKADEFPSGGGVLQQAEFLLRYAVMAPSTHNTQPWKFSITPDGINVYADYGRRMPILDPGSRELLMSIGTAVFNVRIAASYFGMQCTVRYNLGGSSEAPVAQIAFAPSEGRTTPPPDIARLFAGISARHTNRAPFLVSRIPASVLTTLNSVAQGSETDLLISVDGILNQKVADLVAEAETMQWADPAFRKNLAEWIRPTASSHKDGISGAAYGWRGVVDELGTYATRTIDQGRLRAARDRNLCIEAPGLAVLSSDDSVDHWVETGEVLQRLLLVLAGEGLHVSYFNMPIQVPDFRTRLKQLVACRTWPQLLLRIGYSLTPPVPTMRRSVDDVLIQEQL